MIKQILLVACESDVLDALPITLTLAGHKVCTAGGGLDAIKMARLLTPDLIILDTVLPDMDGSTVLDILRRLPSTTHLPTLLLKPRAHRLMPDALRREAANKGLVEPLNPSDLLITVGHILARCEELNQPEAAPDDSDKALEGFGRKVSPYN
ncbi:MAG TPA: response regulator [Candidatus Saccharimonadales bacterium]|nr:response regulator [Candidatus Saccharimonadales bacterium]